MSIQSESVPELQEPDEYGQRHPRETPRLIETNLRLFEKEFDKIPDTQKVCAVKAQKRCPELLTSDFKLMFLRCEVYNFTLAAERYAAYWNKREEVFGEEKAYQRLTLENTILKGDSDEAKVLQRGVYSLVRIDGRTMLYSDGIRSDPSQYSRESVVRVLWYLLHAALEDEGTQKRGLVIISNAKDVQMKNVDRKLSRMIVTSIKSCFPIRLSAYHICHPPSFFSILFRAGKVLLGERLRKRVLVHSGTRESVLAKLNKKYGFEQAELPATMGGGNIFELDSWIKDRRALECK